MEKIQNLNIEKLISQFITQFMNFLPDLLLAIVSLIVGLWFIRRLVHFIHVQFEKRKFDPSLESFLEGFVSIMLKVALFVSVAEMVGFQTTSFVAILGAAGLAVGLALQGSLSNFAGGVVLLIFKPFKTGDYILAQGEEGTVQKIDVFHTWLNKLDNRRVILPNGALAAGTIVNVTAEAIRRVDITVGVSYSANIDAVREILKKIAESDPRVLKDPAPFIAVSAMADSSVNFAFRSWVKTPDYWGVFFDFQERVKKALDEAKISIPFPQRDVHIYNHDAKN
ncbi:mechanosensitive ion channel [bacterium]|nr:mechanosensitive ion channel [bacterium]